MSTQTSDKQEFNTTMIAVLIVVTLVIIFALFLFLSSSKVDNKNDDLALGTSDQQVETIDRPVQVGDTIQVHYRGKLEDGTEFDNSYDRGEPFEFTIGEGRVIQGWEEGFIGMKPGESKTLTIPPEKGYGEYGSPPTIPGNATLIFDVELVAITAEQ